MPAFQIEPSLLQSIVNLPQDQATNAARLAQAAQQAQLAPLQLKNAQQENQKGQLDIQNAQAAQARTQLNQQHGQQIADFYADPANHTPDGEIDFKKVLPKILAIPNLDPAMAKSYVEFHTAQTNDAQAAQKLAGEQFDLQEKQNAKAERDAGYEAFRIAHSDANGNPLPKNATSEALYLRSIAPAKLFEIPQGGTAVDENNPTAPPILGQPRVRNIDPNSPEGIAAALDKARQESTIPARPTAPVAGRDIPLPADVAAQREAITAAGKTAADAPDLQSAISTTRSGLKYVDRSQFTGKEQNALVNAANKAGIPAVSKDTADLLSEIDNARLNLDYMNQVISPKLAKDAAGRPIASLTNTIEKMAQTDPDLAAVGTFRSAAIQAMRAVAGAKGLRINRAEIEQAQENDIPKMTDTLPTAAAKLRDMNTFLNNAEKAHLTKDRSVGAPAAGKFTVTAPDGSVHTFPNAAAADGFRKATGSK